MRIARRHSIDTQKTKRWLFERKGERCDWCGSNNMVELDHVVPLWNGGTNDPSNLQLLCHNCHVTKSRKEAQERKVFDPQIFVVNGRTFVKIDGVYKLAGFEFGEK
jgi:5-methylcytosine-specific restriction endonuclease McrA